MFSKNFYKKLPVIQLPIHEVFRQGLFTDVPEDWEVVVADIKNSTQAVQEGRHNDVNLVAASSIIVALNVGKKHNTDIPFFFTGDGGTMLIPGKLLLEVLAGLVQHNDNSVKNFKLSLHIGHQSVKNIMAAGHAIKIARVEFSKNFIKPVILGNGLKYAEEMIKSPANITAVHAPADIVASMEGLECRWDKVKAPQDNNEIVCYIIEALEPEHHAATYAQVLQKLNEVYGEAVARNPLSIERLNLLLNGEKIKKEMLARFGKWKVGYFVKAFLISMVGKLYFKFNISIDGLRGKDYLRQVINNADTLTIDGKVSTIITGHADKRKEYIAYLQQMEEESKLIFGHHISNESIMTCYIQNRNEEHIHFVDGGDGGYTAASREFKAKWKSKLARQGK